MQQEEKQAVSSPHVKETADAGSAIFFPSGKKAYALTQVCFENVIAIFQRKITIS